jgi:endoglucanase
MKNLLSFFIALSLVQICVADTNAVFVRANQLGYRPDETKIAVAFSSASLPERFTVEESDSTRVAFEGTAKAVSGKWGKFENHAELDFTSFKKSGKYFLQIGEAKSFPFEIRDEINAKLPDELLEFMRQQRCGYNPWLDAVCHPFDGRTAYGPLTNGTYLPCSGGWHDAGDLLKYLITSANATAQMLLAYEISNKHRGSPLFADQHNALGQSGSNGIADILDEAKWGLDWMLKLHPAPDQLYHQIADDRDHKGWRLPQNEMIDYGWGEGKERVVYCADGKPQGLKEFKSEATGVANLAGRYAAAMALAYQIWKDDAKMKIFAEKCLNAGKEVYALGKAKEGYQQGNSYGAPYRYEESTWADDMEWGAAELFRATGDKSFLTDAKRYSELAANDTWMPYEQTKHYQYYPFMNAGHFRLYDLVDKKFQKTLAGYYREGIEQCVARGNKNPYRIGVPFIWCSNNLTTALATQCLMYELMTGDAQYHEFATKQCDWLLGRNPWGTSMFTDLGAVSPKDPHLMANKILHRTIRGGLVDGPVYERIFKSLKGVTVTEPDPFAPFQGELAVYHDDIKDYSTNEPTMDGTASAILLWAMCAR